MSLMQMSLTGGCLIGAIAVFRAMFFRRLPKRTLVWLWAAAALVLLIPLRLSAAFSIYGLLPPSSAAGPQAAAAVPVGIPVWTVVRRVVSVALAVCLAAAYLTGLIRFYQSRIIRDPWAERWLCDHPMRRYLTIRESERISAPVSGGLLRPVILLPRQQEWDEETRTCVLAHEFTHIQKLDGLVKLLAAAALCLHWFNPMVWVMAYCLNRDLEFACDETVLSGETGRADYARALLTAESARWPRPLLAHGFGCATVKRMEAVTRFRRPGTALRAVSLLAAAVLVAVFATAPLPSRAAPVAGGHYVSNVNTDRSSAGPGAAPGGTEANSEPGNFIYVDGAYGLTVQDGATFKYVVVLGASDGSHQHFVVMAGEPVSDGIYLIQAQESVLRALSVAFEAAEAAP